MPLLNSGVIGLMQEDAPLLDRSIALMDEYYPHAKGAYTLEEFCLTVAAYRQMQVNQCTDLIHHYWSRKQLFRAKVQAWLAKHQHAPLTEAALADVYRVNAQLPKPPTLQRLGYKALSLTLPAEQRQFMRELLNAATTTPTSSTAPAPRLGGTRPWTTPRPGIRSRSAPRPCSNGSSIPVCACPWAASTAPCVICC